MTTTPDETSLKLQPLSVQIAKAHVDMQIETRKYRLQTAAIAGAIIALVVAAFIAGRLV